jgi:uncharacterized protein (TIRG00374 family)
VIKSSSPGRIPRIGAALLWALALALAAWALSRVPYAAVGAALARLGVGQLVVLLIANLLVVAALTARWWVILRALGVAAPFAALAGYRLAAFGVSYFTPGPQVGGEPAQVWLLARRHGTPTSAAVSSVALDRLVDAVVNFGMLAVGVGLSLGWEVFGQRLGIEALAAAAALVALPAVFLALVGAGRRPLTWLLARTPARLREADAFTRLADAARTSETEAIRFCRERPAALALAFAVSLGGWALMLAEWWLMARFLGVSMTAPELISAVTAARIAFLMPLPGGLGTLEASQVMAFGALGFDPAAGLALSLAIRARDVLFGGAGLLIGGLAVRPARYNQIGQIDDGSMTSETVVE